MRTAAREAMNAAGATAADIADGSVHWRYLGEGAAAADVAARSVDTGAIVGASGDLTVIDTPVGGWSSVINVLDADPGRDVATDEELRILAESDLTRPGGETPDAIRQTLLALADVESVTVFYNSTDTTDAGRPTLRLPGERNGLMIVFRTFERVSYALVLQITDGVKVGDRFTLP